MPMMMGCIWTCLVAERKQRPISSRAPVPTTFVPGTMVRAVHLPFHDAFFPFSATSAMRCAVGDADGDGIDDISSVGASPPGQQSPITTKKLFAHEMMVPGRFLDATAELGPASWQRLAV